MNVPRAEHSNYSILLRAALTGLGYLAALLLSYHFGGGFDQEANIWLPSGIAIGVLTLVNPRRWSPYLAAIAFAALVGNLASGASLARP